MGVSIKRNENVNKDRGGYGVTPQEKLKILEDMGKFPKTWDWYKEILRIHTLHRSKKGDEQ